MLFFLLPILYSLPFFFTLGDWLMWVQFAVLVMLGYWLHAIDYGLYFFYSETNADLDEVGKTLFKQGRYVEFVKFAWRSRSQMTKLMTHSLLYLVIYVPIALFVVSTSNSLSGMAFVLGVGLHIVWFLLHSKEIEIGSNKPLSAQEIGWLKWGISGGFIVLSLLILFL